jgi:hypothetical protein
MFKNEEILLVKNYVIYFRSDIPYFSIDNAHPNLLECALSSLGCALSSLDARYLSKKYGICFLWGAWKETQAKIQEAVYFPPPRATWMKWCKE